jgi:hypothetical protein
MPELTNVKESYKSLEQELKHVDAVNKPKDEEIQFQRQLSK